MIAATITLPSRSDRAIALARSFRATNPDMRLIVVFVGESVPQVVFPDGVEVTCPAVLGADYDPLLNVALDGKSLQQALRAPVAEALLGDDERVLLIDDAMMVCGSLAVFDEALDTASAVVVADPMARDSEADSLWAGVDRGTVHTGAVAFRDCPDARVLIADWPTNGLAPVERKPSIRSSFNAWCDAVAQRPYVTTLPSGPIQSDLGIGEAASISIEDDGLVADGSPVALLDLSEFDPHRPHLVSTGTRKAPIGRFPELATLLNQHAAVLLAEVETRTADPWTTLADGTPLTPLLRRTAYGATLEGDVTHSVFTDAGNEQLYDWLAGPAVHGAGAGLNLYHEAIWAERIELRAAYPHLDGPDGEDYVGWLNQLRPEQIPMPKRLAAPLLDKHIPKVDAVTTAPPWGVNVTGLLSGQLGLGESARWIIKALGASGVPCKPVIGDLRVPGEQIDEHNQRDTEAPFGINLVCLNGDVLPTVARDLGDDFFSNRYTAALWWWELPELPKDWFPAFDLIDEVWVASDFIYEIVAPVSPVPVHKIRLPLVVSPFESRSREALGMPDDFVFLFVHDYHSTIARKNPVGLINAFRKAFPESSGASLVIKSINADRMQHSHQAVIAAAAGRSDIHLIDGFVDADVKNAMIESCDCYVSLHRSEGFGQTLAEAMSMSRPTIATSFGGNLDFMDHENSLLVRHSMVRVGEDAHPYPADDEWAEPDLDHAAELMQRVFDDPELAAELGRRGAASVERTNGIAVAGKSMRRRLETIHGWIENDPQFTLHPERHVARLPRPGKNEHLSPRKVIRLMLSRIESFFLRRQRTFDSAVTGVERRVDASSAELQGQIDRMGGELDELRAQIDSLQRERIVEDEDNYQR